MNAHTHREIVPGCYRCDLNLDEIGVAGEVETPCATVVCPTCKGAEEVPNEHRGPGSRYGFNKPCHRCHGEGRIDAPACGVETPCATCGGTGELLVAGVGPDGGAATPFACPDCGVETPEAAVEAVAQAVARERCNGQVYMDGRHQVNAKDRRQAREYVTVARYAFIAQGWTPPGGTE